MTDSPDDIPDIPDIPDFAALAADPEIAPLLGFDPVLRQVKRPNGWTDDLQRELIARLAATGTLQQAVWQMGKHATGAEALYKVASAGSFRAAWDQAVAIGRRRQGLDGGPPHTGPVPGITRRPRRGWADPDPVDPDESEDMDYDAKVELLDRLIAKFMLKVGQERAARLAGEVVAADFYLRQVTCLEVAFDLIAEGRGQDGWERIHEFRRGGHTILEIADTFMSRLLDAARREQWARMGEPARPEHPPERYLTDHRDHRTEGLEHTVGGGDSYEDQKKAQAERFAREAAAQVEWEASAQEAWEASEHGAAQRRAYEERRDRDASS